MRSTFACTMLLVAIASSEASASPDDPPTGETAPAAPVEELHAAEDAPATEAPAPVDAPPPAPAAEDAPAAQGPVPTAEAPPATASAPEPTLRVGAAVAAALCAPLGLAVGVGIDALLLWGAIAIAQGMGPAAADALGAAGGLAPLLLVVGAGFAGGGAMLGTFLGGGDMTGALLSLVGVAVGVPTGLVAGSMIGGLVGSVTGPAFGATNGFASFVMGTVLGMGVGALLGAAAGAVPGALVERRHLDFVLGPSEPVDVE